MPSLDMTDIEVVLRDRKGRPLLGVDADGDLVHLTGQQSFLGYASSMQSPAGGLAVLGGAGGTSGQTYTTQTMRYLEMQLANGELWVAVNIRLILTAKGTITGNVQVQGLPRPVSMQSVFQIFFSLLATNKVGVWGLAAAGQTNVDLLGLAAAGTTPANLVDADIANNTQMYLSGLYRAS